MPEHHTRDGRVISYSAPKDTEGMLREPPRSTSKSPSGVSSLCQLLASGSLTGVEASAPASHKGITASLVSRGKVRAQNGGESNRVLPERTSFSGDDGPSRGDEMFHNPTKTRVVVMKTDVGRSKSGKPLVLVQTNSGDRYKVPMDSLSSL